MGFNKKMFLGVMLVALASPSMAVNPAALLGTSSVSNPRLDELKVAQQIYQNLIQEHAREDARARRLVSRLQRAEKKLAKAQFNVNKLRAELMLTRDIQQRQAKELQVAGERLNRAWQAAYGAPTYRVAEKK